MPIPEGRYAELANGYRIHYVDQGEGPAVVFLHGSGAGASGHSNFKQNYPQMAERGYRVIVPDLIGYGLSDKPEDVDYPLDFFVSCVKQALDAIGLERYTLVGNSLGGAIAIKFALDYPDNVDKLILMAPGGVEEQADYFTMPGMAIMAEVFMSPEPITPERMKHFISSALVHDAAVVTDDLVKERYEVFQTMNKQVMASMSVPNMTERLADIHCPCLVFWGINEKMMPETGIMKLAKHLPQVRVVLVSDCGHWVMVEHADLFNRYCMDFLQHG